MGEKYMALNHQQTDENTTIEQIKGEVREFISDRDWEQFHDPKNVTMALASEVGELLDIFRWVKSDDSFNILSDKDTYHDVQMELADIAMFLMDLATICEVDLTSAVMEKIKINNQRYPIEKARGIAEKYTKLAARSDKPNPE